MQATVARRTLFSVTLALGVALVAGTGRAETAAAPAEPALRKVVVFPFEAVNVDPGTTRAFGGLFQSALRARGVTVLDWRPAYDELYGGTGAVESPPPPPPAPVLAPVMLQPQYPAASASSSVVDHATPPAAPGAAAPAPRPPPPPPAPQYYGGPQVIYVQQAPPVAYAEPIPAEPILSAAARKEIAAKAGAELFLEGSLTRLGNQIRVAVLVKDLEGVEINNQVMDARTELDLSNVLERVAQGLVEGRSAAETLDLDNATMHETQKMPERFKLETNMGAILGQVFSLTDEMNHLTLIAFDARFEIKDLMVGLNAGLAFGAGKSDHESEPGLLAGINIAWYLSHSAVSPYLGLGAGIFIGDLLDSEKKSSGGVYDDDQDDSTGMGFHAAPVLGVEFLRNTRIRVHVEFRWMLAFDADGHFGHGPMPLIGINF
jgi:hypothetical protein